MRIDEEKILEAIRESGTSAAAMEEGARLIDHWVSETSEWDTQFQTLAVEAGFYIELDPVTFVVGTQDRIAFSPDKGVFGCEWKTTKGLTKFWNAEKWLESISNGHQIATYAAGVKRGKFVGEVVRTVPIPEGGVMFPKDGVNILVRAITKTTPPQLWPNHRGEFVKVTDERIEGTLNVYRSVAASIRGRRSQELFPWALPGVQCVNQFHKECPFYRECRKFESFSGKGILISSGKDLSPGSVKVVQELERLGRITEENQKDVVVLSASSLGSYLQCAERWRREQESDKEEESEALDVGTVLHTGLAEYYQQMKEGE